MSSTEDAYLDAGMKESVLLYTLGVFGLDFKVRLLYKFSSWMVTSGVILILQTWSGWWNSQELPFTLIANPNNEGGWWKYPSTSMPGAASHIFWYGMASCNFFFQRNPPTVRAAATSTTVVTARGTWEMSAASELRVSLFVWMAEASSVHKRVRKNLTFCFLSWSS